MLRRDYGGKALAVEVNFKERVLNLGGVQMKIGFDFGTSFSALAVYRDGEIHRIMFDGEPQFRTAVYFPPFTPSADQFPVDDYLLRIADIRADITRLEKKEIQNQVLNF